MRKIYFFFACMLCMMFGVQEAMALNNTTKYAKVTATAVSGEGKVYVNTTKSDADATYATESSADNNVTNTSASADFSFYVFAQAEEGYDFVGWTTENDEEVSTDNPYTCVVSSNKTDSNNPETRNLKANFKLKDGHTEIPLIIDAANKWGTLILPFAAAIPDGVEVYTVGGTNGSSLTLTQVKSGIEAQTCYILKAENGVNTKFAGQFDVSSLRSLYSNNNMTGKLTEKYPTIVPENSYVLQKQGDVVGFYQVTKNSPDILLPLYRCYLSDGVVTDKENAAKAFFFNTASEEETTAIGALNAVMEGKAAIYDMNGRKLNSLQKGINIVNGKKILVK